MIQSVLSSAPSNIALIKYMGKTSSASNIPTNSSLSYTLEGLRTYVSLKHKISLKQDTWQPLSLSEIDQKDLFQTTASLAPLNLNEKSVQKFLRHLNLLKKEFQIATCFEVKSANTFPSDAGLASSASSFAALTKAFFQWLIEKHPEKIQHSDPIHLIQLMSSYSRLGSGSSCRSFYSPWSLWDSEGAQSFQSVYGELDHLALVVSADKKEVSSSQAHELVLSSPKFEGRILRAENRLKLLRELLNTEGKTAWAKAYHVCWDEFIDMHDLFHTSKPSFRYMTEASDQALHHVEKMWAAENDGPLVTMDAGPNIHLLFRPEQGSMKSLYIKNLSAYGSVIESPSLSSKKTSGVEDFN
ncbi:MAG: diphosphomevalonate decarboxylase [Pseudobdellovibrionaceae bacterium]